MNFLVNIIVDLPRHLSEDERASIIKSESDRGLELMRAGKLVNIWRVPGQHANVSLYDVGDATELHELISSLPMWPWLHVEVQPLAEHPLERRRAQEDGSG